MNDRDERVKGRQSRRNNTKYAQLLMLNGTITSIRGNNRTSINKTSFYSPLIRNSMLQLGLNHLLVGILPFDRRDNIQFILL